MTTEELQQQFGSIKEVTFTKGESDFTFINVACKHAKARICLYGAQLLSYIPAGQKEILWLSKKALFQNGKAIRGGIPVCFPWFGPHPSDKTKPQHGFARIENWDVVSIDKKSDEAVIIVLELNSSESSLQLWPHQFKAQIEFVIGESLAINFTITNTDDNAFDYSDALHTYYHVSDIAKIAIEGLEETDYFEFSDDAKTQSAPVLTIDTETDRKYIHHSTHCTIHDPGFKRSIIASKKSSNVTVVWNPWVATTKKMSDMEEDGYKTFVCIEPANAIPGIDIITLKPGKSHTLALSIESSHA